MACDEPSKITGPTELVLLQSDRGGWSELLLCPPKRYRGKLLSELIVLVDDGPFSHVVLHRGACVVDAKRPYKEAKPPHREVPAVGSWPFAEVEKLERDRTRCRLREGDLSLAWDTVVAQRWFPTPPLPAGAVPPGLPAESNRFGYGALVLVALNLATTEFRFLRPFGRWLLRRHRDLEGMFCSELIAKAMVDAGLELMVTVRPARIPPVGSRSEQALLDVLVARRDRNLPDAAALDEDAARESFAAQLGRLRGLALIAANPTVPVGYPGDEPTLPPSLVTPNDLYRSPNFEFVGNHDGTSQPPVLTPCARRRRFAKYVVALALTPVNSAIGGRFDGAYPQNRHRRHRRRRRSS